jgi:putative restriction endonuclease
MADLFVGVTDNQWFRFLRDRSPDEINFWKPGGQPFKALQPGGLFFFKLHAPQRMIAGYGVFISSSILPLKLAWEAFGEKNGVASLEDFQRRIARFRRDNDPNPMITNIILAQPVFRPDDGFISQPNSWKDSIVVGKGYSADSPEGRVMMKFAAEPLLEIGIEVNASQPNAYAERMQKVRLGQGAFRVLVTDSYQRRCAISGERTLPVLQAAHIRPYAQEGPHDIRNGLLLRSDIHTLFDDGYITVTPDYHVEVSKRIREEFENGRDYYRHHGNQLLVLPPRDQQPMKEYLHWHNTEVYKP